VSIKPRCGVEQAAAPPNEDSGDRDHPPDESCPIANIILNHLLPFFLATIAILTHVSVPSFQLATYQHSLNKLACAPTTTTITAIGAVVVVAVDEVAGFGAVMAELASRGGAMPVTRDNWPTNMPGVNPTVRISGSVYVNG
jgi:hypothetical protein